MNLADTRLRICLLALLTASPAAAFEINGRHWSDLPVTYYINPAGCPVLENGDTIVEILEDATANWEGVVCANVVFACLGETDVGWANDDQNTIFCVDHDWTFGEGAAGATLWLPKPPETPEVDLALNAADLTWKSGGGDGLQTDVIDPVAVVTHELGHWLGLAHTPEPFATMYYANLPNGMGASLEADDRAGICSLYPSGNPECTTDEDCEPDQPCINIEEIPVCQESHDPAGAFCSKDYLNCEGMCWVSFYECYQVCLFTSADYLEGYCAPLCNDGVECPGGFDCTYLPTYEVNICLLAEPDEDGGDGQDAWDDDGGAADGEPAITDDGGGLEDDGPAADADAGTGDLPGDEAPPADASAIDDDQPARESNGCNCGKKPGHGGLLPALLLLVWVLPRVKTRFVAP